MGSDDITVLAARDAAVKRVKRCDVWKGCEEEVDGRRASEGVGAVSAV